MKTKVDKEVAKTAKKPKPKRIKLKGTKKQPAISYSIGLPEEKFLVHPAQHFCIERDEAYFGFALPLIKKEKDEEGAVETTQSDEMMLISLGNRPIPCLKSWCEPHGIHLLGEVEDMDSSQNRITAATLNAIINNDTKYFEDHVLNPIDAFIKTVEMHQELIFHEDIGWHEYLSLWILGTYCFSMFSTFPQVYFWGARGSAKSKHIDLAKFLGFNAESSPNLSPSSLFRTIESCRAVLLLDEMEKIADKDKYYEIRSMLLAGYKRGATVKRTEPSKSGKMKQRRFQVYSPKMIANIDGIDQTLQDRCVTITTDKLSGNMISPSLKKIINSEVDTRRRRKVYSELRDSYYVTILQHWHTIQTLIDEMENIETVEGISARHLELWRSILVMAKFIESFGDERVAGLEKRMNALISRVMEAYRQAESDSNEHTLIRAIYSIINEDLEWDDSWVSYSDIAERWAKTIGVEYDDGKNRYKTPKWMTNRYLGRILRSRLGFRPAELKRSGASGSFHALLTQKKIIKLVKHFDVRIENLQLEKQEKIGGHFPSSDGPVSSVRSVNNGAECASSTEHTECPEASEHTEEVYTKIKKLWEKLGVGLDKSISFDVKYAELLNEGMKLKLIANQMPGNWYFLTTKGKQTLEK